MVLTLDGELICEISLHPEPEGVTYAVIRPDGRSSIFGRRDYMLRDLANLARTAAKQALGREEK